MGGFPIEEGTSVPILFRNVTTSDDDYSIQGTLAIPVLAGEESGSATLTFTPTEDGLKEARTESLLIEGAVSEHYVIGTDFRIIDSPTIQLTVPPVSVAENGGAQTVTVTAELGDPGDSTRGRPIVVSLNLSGSAGPGDYTFAETLQVTIPAGARSGSASFTLTPTDDRLLEGDETIVVSGSTPALTVVGTGTITIEDDETAPEVILTANPDTIQEDDSVPTQITVSAVLDPDVVLPDDATVVTLTLGGTATAGTGHDYTSAWDPQTSQITIPQGEREGETTVTLTVTPLQDEVAEGEETIVVEGTASTGLVVDVRGSVITVVDDDIPGIVLEPKSIEVTEGGTASYTVALALQPTETVTVTMTTALGATDLSVDITELYFTPENWNQPQTVNVDAMEDVDAVADETVTLVHEASGGAYEGVTSEATVTIKENDAPNVTVSSTALQILEGMNGMYSVVLTSQPTGDVTVTMDTDLANTDLSATPSPTELTFTTLNWDQPQIVTVSAAVDADAVDDPAVTLEHSVSGGDYGGVTVSSVTVTIIEQTVPTLSVTGGSAQEGASVDFVVTLSAQSSKAVTVGYATADDTATSPDDYAAASSSLTFAPGETTKTVTVATRNDIFHEPTETFTLGLTNPTNAEIQSGAGTATGTITDDDPAPTAVTLSLNPTAAGESAAATAVTVTASLNNSPLPTATTVTVSRTGGTATSGTDYPPVSAFTVTIPAEQTSGTATLSFDPSGDGLAEGDETVILTGSATGLTAGTATLTITDDDTAPTAVTISLNPAAVGESATATAVTVTASLNNSPLPAATTVTVTRTGGTATSGTDYTAINAFTVTIPSGQTSGTATLSFDPSGDSLAEGDETVILTGSAAGLDAGTATLTITDDDTAPTAVMLSLNPSAVGESATATTVTVTASLNNSPLPTATTVTVSRTGGTATSGTDYTAINAFTVTIPSGQTSGTATLSFDPSGDGLAEGDETVILTGSATGLTAGAATLTITDDDTAPTAVTLSLNPAAMGESAAATTVTVTASLNNSPLPAATTVTVSRTGGTATSGTDYTAINAFTVTIPSGQTSGTATLSFDPSGDSLAEGGETVILTGSATGLTSGTATLTITDDDPAPTAVTLSLNPAAVGESAAATTVTVTASLNNSPLPTATTVTVSRTGGTATSGTDYTAINAFTVTIPSGQTSGTATLSFDPTGDGLYEGNETVILTGSVAGLTAGAATLTITDDDPAPTAITLSLNPAAVSESAAATAVTVTASLNNSPLPTATTVTVSRTGGTATSGTDYPPVSAFTVTIQDGQTSGTATLSFDPSGDGLYEGDETVILTSSTTGLTGGTATLTITDDDPAPTAITLSLNPAAVGESATATTVTVTASLNNSPLPTATTVTVSRTGGTATSGTDYPAVTDFVITIPAEQTSGTATLSFDPTGDGLYEGDETVILTGSAAGLAAGTATLTITDDDPAPTAITLSLNPAAVGESATATAVTVTASLNNSPLPAATTVTVTRTGGTATSGYTDGLHRDQRFHGNDPIRADQWDGDAVLRPERGRPGGGGRDGHSHRQRGRARRGHSDADHHGRRPGADGGDPFAEPGCRGRIRRGDGGHGHRLAEQLAAARSDHGYREPYGWYGHLGHGLPGDQRFHGDDSGGSDQWDGGVVLRSERGQLGGGRRDGDSHRRRVRADLWHGDADHHGRRHGADGGDAVAQPGCRGRERGGDGGDGCRLVEQLAAARSDHGYREPYGWYGHLGHGLPDDQRFHGDDSGGSDQWDGGVVLRSERGQPGGGRRDGDSHRQRDGADLWHGDADHHGRRHGADGNNAFTQPDCGGRIRCGDDGDGYRLVEQLAAARSDHGYREPYGWYGHCGYGLPDDQRFHGDDSGGSDQWDGGVVLRSERGQLGGGRRDGDSHRRRVRADLWHGDVDHHGRRRGADGSDAVFESQRRGRECHSDDGYGDRLAERLTAADGDHGDREQDRGHGHLGYGLHRDQRLHGDDPGWADQRDGDAVLQPDRGRPGGGRRDGDSDRQRVRADLWHGDSDDHGRRPGADGGDPVA